MQRIDRYRRLITRSAAASVAALVTLITASVAPPRILEGASRQPSLIGIWEPVNYKGDIAFQDVLFVTADRGWVAGVGSPSRGGGVILHTKDGGKTWQTQFGDPESSDRAVDQLFFLDERRGWARQGTTLLRTTDGETWEAAGTVSGYAGGYVFISPTVGIMAGGADIKRTVDGGRSWTTAGKCAATVTVDGLTKQAACTVRSLHFPSRRVGYAVGDGYEKAVYLLKTTDGGASWHATTFPAESGGYDVFFTDERRGFVRTRSRTIYGTEDGGSSWRPIAGNPIGDFKFADPVVGWSMEYREMLYTTNGGRAWIKREIPFPAMVTAFSLPRRDRGYAVGEHGMIYRYSVVKSSHQVAGALPAPVMPAFETLLDDRIEALDDFVESLEESIAKLPDDAGAGATVPGSTGAGGAGNVVASGTAGAGATSGASGSDDDLFAESTDGAASPSGASGTTTTGATAAAPPSPFIEKCCGKSLSRWYLAMQAAETILPQFVAQFKNTNLLGAGLRMLVVLPARVNATIEAFGTFKRSANKAEAKENVAQLNAAVDALKLGVTKAVQKEEASR